jgi:hypothetical protein
VQTVYATHLALPDTPDAAALDVAAEVLVRWVRSRFKVDLKPLSGGEASNPGLQVRWEQLLGDGYGVISTVIDQVDRYDPGWRWRTHIDLGVEGGAAWLRARVQLYSAFEGRLTSPRVHPGRPGVIRAIADALDVRMDGWQLGEWRTIGRDAVPGYLNFLTSRDRQIPVVALSASRDGELYLDPARTADRLLGLAHVVVVDPDASFAVSDGLGKELSCYWGAVRIYWPGLRRGDDPYHHRLFVGGALEHFGREGLAAEIFETLGRLAGLSIDRPALRRRLEIERHAQELTAHEQERAELRQRVSDAAGAGDDQELLAMLTEEYEQMEAKANAAESALLDAEIEVETFRQERDEARRQLVELTRTMGMQPHGPEGTEEDPGPPATVLDAVNRAALRSEHTIFLPEAFDSADQSQYQDPSRVLDDLRLVEEIARDWATGELATGPHEAFKQRCSGYRDGIGQKASTQYAVDYEREYQDERIMLGPHIRRGIGAVSAILRIYLYFDSTHQKILVGHVGRKLRDDSNRN